MKNNKKGFTLVELLAVIVILAVIMLIGVTAIGPIMASSRKSALGLDGIQMVDAAKMAYQAEQITGTSIKATDTVCFDLKYLVNKQYYDKANTGYTGSALVKYDPTTVNYTYSFWITDGTYVYEAATVNDYKDKAKDGSTGSANCGGTSANVTCTETGCTRK